MGQIDKEWLVLVSFDEPDRFFGIAAGQRVAVGGSFDDALVSHQGQGRPRATFPRGHVVAVGNAEELVESLSRRQEFGLIPQVPLTDNCRAISPVLEHFCQRDFIIMQALPGKRLQDPASVVGRVHANAAGIAAGQQRRPGRSANPGGDIEAGQPQPCIGHLVEVRGSVFR